MGRKVAVELMLGRHMGEGGGERERERERAVGTSCSKRSVVSEESF